MSTREFAAGASFVLLQVGDRRFGLPAEIVSELAPPVRLHTFPHHTALVSGVIVRRGRIVPVFDVSSILSEKSSFNHRFYLIAQRRAGNTTEASAIPLSGECELASAEIRAAGEGRAAYVAGLLHIGEETIEVLDFEKLVNYSTPQAADSDSAEARP
jgi:chemotaxis signal transduction protein